MRFRVDFRDFSTAQRLPELQDPLDTTPRDAQGGIFAALDFMILHPFQLGIFPDFILPEYH